MTNRETARRLSQRGFVYAGRATSFPGEVWAYLRTPAAFIEYSVHASPDRSLWYEHRPRKALWSANRRLVEFIEAHFPIVTTNDTTATAPNPSTDR